jgi:Flp pilus assembly protein TadG
MTGRGDYGSVTVEVVLLTPILLAAACFVVFLGRLGQARAEVDQLAHLAAATAATARPAPTAVDTAWVTAQAAAREAGRLCRDPDVAVDDHLLRPGGHVTVTVTCTVSLADLTPLALPGSHTVTAVEVAPVDRYRTGTPLP